MAASVYITQEQILNIYKCKFCVIEQTEADLHPCQASKMKCFEKKVNFINPITVFAKTSFFCV